MKNGSKEYVWSESQQYVKALGTEEIFLSISDRLISIVDSIKQVYPYAKYRVCYVHAAHHIPQTLPGRKDQ